MASVQPSTDFSQFCDFVTLIRDSGVESLTPEESVQQYREEQEKLRRWNERNEISAAQAARGEAKPLDLEAVLKRVELRLADRGAAE